MVAKQGKSQFLPFHRDGPLGVVFTDILVGIAMGMAISILDHFDRETTKIPIF